MRFFIGFSLLMLVSISCLGKTGLNSICYTLDQSTEKIQGTRADELFEIASVSKIVTSYWAISQLGPDFRFSTRIHTLLVDKGLYDVHIEGGRDPFWGRHLTHLLFAELNRRGIKSIRQLSFDENLIFRWNVMTDYILPAKPTSQEIAVAFRNHLRDLAAEYPRTRREAATIGVSLPTTVSLKATAVIYLPRAEFVSASTAESFVLKSAPLYRYMKEVNMVSNNHVADKVFDYLGGAPAFQSFAQNTLKADAQNIQLINGSGDSFTKGDQPPGAPVIKSYNRASCAAIVRVLIRFEELLQKKYKMDLRDVMAVSGADDSTLNPRYASIPNTLVAKTGTVDPAITLGGLASTAQGKVYFGVFMDTNGPGDWNRARDLVRKSVFDLIDQFGGSKRFAYTPQPFLPFDGQSMAPTSSLKTLPLP